MILYYVNEISKVFKTGGHTSNFLTFGNSYEGNLTPTIIDPNTYLPVDPSYIIKCDDGMFRKFDSKHFVTEQEWKLQQLKMNRDNKLKELGI